MPALQCRTLARASLMSLGVVALPAQAASYLLGPVDVQVDTTLSADEVDRLVAFLGTLTGEYRGVPLRPAP